MSRALRHGLAATALVVVVCGACEGTAAISYARAPSDRALSGLVYPALVAAVVLGFSGWLWVSRARSFRGPGRACLVRRVRVQRGLLVRSWLETEEKPRRWIPVFFEPELVTLPSPATVRLHG